MGDGWQHKDDYPDDPNDRYSGGGGPSHPNNWTPRMAEARRQSKRRLADEKKAMLRREVAPVAKPRAPWDEPPTPWYNESAARAKREASKQTHPSVAQAATPIRSKYAMNTAEAITLIQLSQGARIVAGQYEGGSADYHFKDVLGLGLKKDDFVVVQTKGSMSLVKVTNPDVLPTDCGCSLDKLKHVICRVDTDALDAVIATERQAVHKLALSEVNDRLSTYRKQLGEGGFADVERLLAPAAPAFRPNAQTEEALRDSRAGRTHRATDLDDIIEAPAHQPPYTGRD